MKPRHGRQAMLISAILTLAAAIPGFADEPSPSKLRERFESEKPAWRQEETDATVAIKLHDRTDRARHDGERSERIRFTAGPGSAVYYSYSLTKVPVVRDLEASVYIKSNRAGIKLLGRVVLPADKDPESGLPSFVMVEGTISELADVWQRLELANLPRAIERQARVLRVGSGRKVSTAGAYLERLVLNLYGGPGDAEVFIDDLTVSPVPITVIGEPDAKPSETPAAQPNPIGERDASDSKSRSRVQLKDNQLTKDGAPWVPTIIHAPGADPKVLWQHGFDVLALDSNSDAKLVADAASAGFLLMPLFDTSRGLDPTALLSQVASFEARRSVAWWCAGDRLGRANDFERRKSEIEHVRKIAAQLRDRPTDESRLLTASVEGEFAKFAAAGRGLSIVGVDSNAWGTSQHPFDTLYYLKQRRDLTALRNPHALFWAWIDATPPSGVSEAIWGSSTAPAAGRPEVQTEQIRWSTYAALAAGYRGLAFRAGEGITQPVGEERLIEFALLNAELSLIERLIARGFDPIPLYPTFPPDAPVVMVYNPSGGSGGISSNRSGPQQQQRKEANEHKSIRAASIMSEDRRTRLLLVVDLAEGAQWQPPQMAQADLKIVIPAAQSAQAFEITLGGVRRSLERERVTGGVRVTLPAFSVTSLVLVTADYDLIQALEAEVARISPWATDFAIRGAQYQLDRVAATNSALLELGEQTRDASKLLLMAREHIESARAARDREDYATSWSESSYSRRYLRVLMRDHHDKALKEVIRATRNQLEPETLEAERDRAPDEPKRDLSKRLITPISCPPLISFATLPRAYTWLEWIKGSQGGFGPNRLVAGDFEAENSEAWQKQGWNDRSYITEDVRSSAQLADSDRREGGRALELKVEPKDPAKFDSLTPFLDHPAIAVESPPVPVRRNNFVRIRVWVKMPREHPRGAGGLIIRDSLGGAFFQFRSTAGIRDWSEVVLYRLAPNDGELSVTLGLAGYGTAMFDDLRVELIEAGEPTPNETPAPLARRPTARAPSANLPRR